MEVWGWAGTAIEIQLRSEDKDIAGKERVEELLDSKYEWLYL
jgi:hypothetical protein